MKQGWEIKKIRDICDKASSNIVQNKIAELDGDYPVYGASGYVQNVDFFHRDSPYIGIVKDGAGVGRVNIYPAYSSLLGTLQYIIPKDGYLLEYVAYALKGLNLASYASGATIPHIYFKNYGETEISVAPLSEQEKIVAELDCLSGIIEKKKQQLKEYDALAQSIFYEMFGDPITNDKGWEVKKVKDVFNVKIGPFGSLLHNSDYISGGTPLVNPIHMQDEKICPDFNFSVSCEKLKELDSYLLQPNDIVFARRGDIGRCVIVGKEENGYLCGTGSLFIRPTQPISPVFMLKSFRCKSMIEHLTSLAKGATMLNINCKIIEELNIIMPPLALQQEFASKIEAIEKQKELIKQSIAETEILFNSRMDFYFN